MKLFIIADIEDLSWQHGTGNADVLLSCGDTNDQVILQAAEAYGCSRIFAVKGNHDRNTPFPDPIIDLHLQVCEYGGLRFGGFNGAWKYKPKGHFLYEQTEAKFLLDAFPPVDIFLSHNSPRHVHDRDDGIHYGFDALTSYIERTQPKLLIHGHQHLMKESQIGETRVIGVHGYRIIRPTSASNISSARMTKKNAMN